MTTTQFIKVWLQIIKVLSQMPGDARVSNTGEWKTIPQLLEEHNQDRVRRGDLPPSHTGDFPAGFGHTNDNVA